MQVEENTANNTDEGEGGGGHMAVHSTDDENAAEHRPGPRFTKRNYRKRSSSSGSDTPLQPDYNAVASASHADTNRNVESAAVVVAENAPEDARSSDDEHSNPAMDLYGMTTDSNSSSSSSSSSVSTTEDEPMSEDCTSDSDVSEETENKSNRALNRPTPK